MTEEQKEYYNEGQSDGGRLNLEGHDAQELTRELSAGTSPDTAGMKAAAEQRMREAKERVDATAGIDSQIRTVQDWMNAAENRPETDGQRKKRERQERSKRIIAAVSDGLGALSNIFFASKYAPDMSNPGKSMTAATDGRIGRMKAERDAKRNEYNAMAMRLGELQARKSATLRDMDALHERQRLARAKENRDAEAHGWLAALQPDRLREQAGKADKAEADARTAGTEAEYAGQYWTERVNRERTQADKNSRWQPSRGGRPGEYPWYDSNGNLHYAHSYEAMRQNAIQHGTWKERTQTTQTDTEGDLGKSHSTTMRSAKGSSAKPKPQSNPKGNNKGWASGLKF